MAAFGNPYGLFQQGARIKLRKAPARTQVPLAVGINPVTQFTEGFAETDGRQCILHYPAFMFMYMHISTGA